MTEWTLLGAVVVTQIHTDRMVNEGVYEADMIVRAEELWLGADGVVGQINGQSVLHGHHRLHPNKTRIDRQKAFLPHRLLSIGFTGHYHQMVEEFGDAPIGCAAEDIVVERAGTVSAADLAGGVQLRRGDQVVELDGVVVAKPCVPFTKWLLKDLGADEATVATKRAFLGNGMRGFVMGLAGQTEPVAIRTGDEVWARA